ncbi:MAG: tetratricopeptide repeat protein, partial [Bacteroidia bacterium]|nr:tetratricopeptide repeat protein [Bacteroidia bacterium]
MIRYLFILIVLANPIIANDLLDKAAVAYDSKDYKQAIECYNQLIKEGNSSYELYYNLGNAYYRNKELGYAIYNYELARKLNPNDQDVQINLGIASSKTIDNIDAKENFFINAIKSNIVNSFTTNTWAVFSIVLAFLTCLLFFLFIAGNIIWVKRISFFFSIASLVFLIVVYMLGKSALNSKKENKFAIIL